LKENKELVCHLLVAAAEETLDYPDRSGATAFHLMAVHGFDALLASCLKINMDAVFKANHLSRYPIHEALLNGQLDIVKRLLPLKKTACLTDREDRSPLHYAVLYGTEEMLKICCKNTHNLDPQDSKERTPLMLAVIEQNIKRIEVLMEYGANPTLTDADQSTLLHLAVRTGNTDIVSWVLNNTPVDVNGVNQKGLTALAEAQALHNDNIEHILVNGQLKIK
ncbi:MAG: ankyrin repeat domain-containing protein, partial [Methylococcales bacterium]|nr:ankyrin repeat domain-containing protein [Methylococcales bacterium]